MPHVDELLGITTLASMGLLVAIWLQPMDVAEAVPAVFDAPPSTPVAAGVPASIAKERT